MIKVLTAVVVVAASLKRTLSRVLLIDVAYRKGLIFIFISNTHIHYLTYINHLTFIFVYCIFTVFSDPFSCNQKNKRIFLTYTNLDTDDDLNILRALIRLFDIHANTTWSERVTHLIVKTADDGSCLRTKKYLNALLSNCFIVTFEWAKDCLSTKTLLPEVLLAHLIS